MSARIESLGQIEHTLWGELALAAQDRKHAWHVLALATVQGERAAARNVVLREVLQPEKRLLVYSDSRSHKVQQIKHRPLGTLLAWSPALGWQLRLEVSLSVVESGLEVSSRWARVKLTRSAQDYLAALPPGTPVDRYEPERGSREHFAVLTAQVSAIDWLELHEDGHRRARFDEQGARWLAP
jgi:pyridoxamine 5'-phosphate oxidase